MIPTPDSEATVISIERERAARQARQPRPRCAATTADGRPCRNYAVAGGLCRIHAAEREVQAERSAAAHPAERIAGRATRDARRIDLVDGLREVLGDRWTDPIAEVAGFVRRRLTGDYPIDVFGLDGDLLTNVFLPLIRPLHRYYWRVGSIGTERIPDGGALLVANHAGTVPADGIMTKLDVYEQTGRHLRELGADLVFRLPFSGPAGRKFGATLACNEDAERLLTTGELVAVWPEGFKGIGKPYRERYRLQRFGRGGFVAVALRAQVPIVPVAIVGSEEIYPLVYNVRTLARLLKLPYFPIVAQMFLLPVLGPLAALPLPSKWLIEYGEPIDTREYGPGSADDPMAVFDLTDRVRDTIQRMLDRNVAGRRSVFR